nr:MAG TPA: hypothetical protein [Bacteriophage sp.]
MTEYNAVDITNFLSVPPALQYIITLIVTKNNLQL